MKNKPIVFCFTLLAFITGIRSAAAQGTAFIYQGRLNDGASPATGIYDLRFTIYDSTNNPGAVIAGPVVSAATGVPNGLFTVTLDFGPGVFTGASRWLEIGVRTNGASTFVALNPRQPLTATPYAVYAGGVNASGIAGPIADGQLSANIARLNSNLVFTGAVQFSNPANSFVGNGAGITNVSLSTINAGGLMTWPGDFVVVSSPGVGRRPKSVVAADVNGDGRVDLISANSADSTLSVLTKNGGGSFVLASSPGVGSGPISVAAADVNGDGSMDLISANLDASTLSVLTNNGVGRFVLAFSLDVGSGPESVAAADVNGDGRVDLISANSADSTLSVLTNNGVGGFVLAFTPDVGDGPRSVAAADVNGDGRVDLISANYYANTLSVLINNGPGGFVLASSPSVGIGPAAVAAADVNGDGRVDLISANWGGPFFHPPPPPPGTTLSGLFNAPATHGVLSGNGSELTSLSAGNIASGTLADVRLSTNVALLNADQSFTGKNTIAPPATLSFGSATRQMLNLYATDYGIGVQSTRLYFRSAFGAGFCWFLGGTHSDSSDNPGSGGTVAMSLNSAALGIGTNAPAAQLHVVSIKASAAENGATFYAPNIGTEASHIQYGTDGDWYIRSSKTTGKVVLQDHGGNVGIGNGNPTDRLMVVNAHCDGNNSIISSAK